LNPIQKVIRSVQIPETFAVTQVAGNCDCFLKSILNTGRYIGNRLRSSPLAELGKISHAVIESSARDTLHGKPVSAQIIERKFEKLIADYQTRARTKAKPEKILKLKRTMPPLAWERKKRTLIDLALVYSNRMKRIPKTFSKPRKKQFSFQDAIGLGRWFEVAINVPALRLKGRIDILERTPEGLLITDFKFGDIKDEDGLLKSQIAMQLRLYGLMAASLDQTANISLFVNDGNLNPVPFDSKIANETKDWLRSLTDELPSGTVVQSEGLSKVGSDCLWCHQRHRCIKYRKEAPALWSREIEWRLPLDTWGRVDKLSMKDELAEIGMTDAGGRLVKIFGVRDQHLTNVKIGNALWLFNLAVSRRSCGGTTWRHPLNFHEINIHDEFDRAWSTQIFIDRDHS
jgi:RecB family exonuclease